MKKLFILWLTLAISAGTLLASDIEVDGIWYDFDKSSQTATVTYRGDSYSSYYDRYAGAIVIPELVTYSDITYSVTSIGEWAFYECNDLVSVSIPNSVISIERGAFAYCDNLTSVSIPNSVTNIGVNAFFVCRALNSIELPNSITYIDNSAFSYCTGLTSLTIPYSVTYIGDGAFSGCSNIVSINIDATNPSYTVVDGVIFSKDKTILVGFPAAAGNYIIPNSVTRIGGGAFSDSPGLTSVTIPNSVTSIGRYAFDICRGLTSITIPSSVTSIGTGAFRYCSGMTSVSIPNSLTYIDYDAFKYCTSLTSITNYAATPQEIVESVFEDVDKANCTLYVNKESLKLYKSADIWKDFGNISTIPGTKENVTINYLNKAGDEFDAETITLNIPEPPAIIGFTFVKWIFLAGDMEDGLNIQAVYTADSPSSAPKVYTNPANSAQKLIRNGNVYILTGDKTYTITGTEIK